MILLCPQVFSFSFFLLPSVVINARAQTAVHKEKQTATDKTSIAVEPMKIKKKLETIRITHYEHMKRNNGKKNSLLCFKVTKPLNCYFFTQY